MLLDNPFSSDSRVERELKALHAQGFKINMLALRDEELPEKEEYPFVTVYRILQNIIKYPTRQNYYEYIEKMATQIVNMKPDVIHCHEHHCLTLGLEVKNLMPDVKVIYDSHEFLAGWPMYKDIPQWFNRLKGLIVYRRMVAKELAIAKKCDEVIAVNDSLSVEMQKHLELPKAPTVVKNIPPKFTANRSNYFHEHFALPSETKVLIHSGNIYHTASRMKMLFDVVQSIENLALVMVGDSQSVKEYEKKTNLPNVYFHKYLHGQEFFDLIASGNFGLVHTWKPTWPSHWFSLPNRIYEYSMAGLPVICTKQPEFMKLGDQFGHATFYKGDSKEELKKAIQDAINREDELRANAATIGDKVNWETESKQLIDLYMRLV